MPGKRYKKGNKAKVILIILLLIIIITIGIVSCYGINYIKNKISRITFKDLDENDLAINDEMYNQVSNIVSKEEYDNIINIILLGSDSKDMENMYDGRSDCQIIISINRTKKNIKLISIPRDTAVDIPGVGRNKINEAFAIGKEQLTLKTINSVFNLNLKEYVTINISGMYEIINKIGGIELNITKAEMEYINQTAPMFYEFSGNSPKKLTKYGKVTVDGEQASAHAKDRFAGGNDFTRTRRQRDILIAIATKIADMEYNEMNKAIDLVLENITTNIDVSKYMALIPELYKYREQYFNSVIQAMIPDETYAKSIYEKINGNRLYLFDPDIEKTKEMLLKYIYEM